MKTKLSGKKLYPSNWEKYIGVRIDQFLHWHDQANNIASKLNRTNALLFKIRNYVKMKPSWNIYLYYLTPTYSCIVWTQNINAVNRLIIHQKTALRIMNHKEQLHYPGPFVSKNNVLKFGSEITLENIHFVNKSNIRQVPPVFYDWFTFPGNLLRYKNCWSVNDHLNITVFCCFSIRARTIYSWNSIQKIFIKHSSLKN